MRFPLKLTEALISVFRADRVGVRISPSGTWGAISDSDPKATFGALAEALNAYGLAYLHIIEPRVSGVETVQGQEPEPPPICARSSRDRSSPPADLTAAAPRRSWSAVTRMQLPSAGSSHRTLICRNVFGATCRSRPMCAKPLERH
jgi:2,4-dienoyl-CoA reductase-like NADH-dependent reductase (Old Yellow Enzyme family)